MGQALNTLCFPFDPVGYDDNDSDPERHDVRQRQRRMEESWKHAIEEQGGEIVGKFWVKLPVKSRLLCQNLAYANTAGDRMSMLETRERVQIQIDMKRDEKNNIHVTMDRYTHRLVHVDNFCECMAWIETIDDDHHHDSGRVLAYKSDLEKLLKD